jgi:hypothetical protein
VHPQLEALQRSALSRIGQRRYGRAPGHGLIQCDDDEDLDMDDVEMPVVSIVSCFPEQSEHYNNSFHLRKIKELKQFSVGLVRNLLIMEESKGLLW